MMAWKKGVRTAGDKIFLVRLQSSCRNENNFLRSVMDVKGVVDEDDEADDVVLLLFDDDL